MCQCFGRGCIHVVFNLSFCWKTLLVIHICCSAHSSTSIHCYCSFQRHVFQVHLSRFLGLCLLWHGNRQGWQFCHLLESYEEGCISLYTNVVSGRIWLESWSLHTEESGMLLNTKWQTHGDDAIRVTDWQVCKLGNWKTSFLCWFARAIESITCATFSQTSFFWVE